MANANKFELEGNSDDKFQVLLTFQSSKLVKMKIIDGKIFGDLDELACPYIVDLALCSEKLAIAFLGQSEFKFFATQVGEITGSHVIPCTSVAYKTNTIIDEGKLEEMFIYIDKFVSMLTSHEHGTHQDNLFLKLTSELQATLKRTADEFLWIHAGKQIKSPINFLFGNHIRRIHGRFLPRPNTSEIDGKRIDLEGFFDGYKLHKHELYILNERGKQITIYFDIDKDIGTILDLPQRRHHPMIFVVQEKLDAKNKVTFKLIAVKPIDSSPILQLKPT